MTFVFVFVMTDSKVYLQRRNLILVNRYNKAFDFLQTPASCSFSVGISRPLADILEVCGCLSLLSRPWGNKRMVNQSPDRCLHLFYFSL